VRPRIDVESVVELLAVTRVGATAVVVSPQLSEIVAADRAEAASRELRACQSILFTSGSSGTPKGVRLTTSNWQAAARASVNRLGHGLADRWLCPLPLHHVGGLSIIYRSLAVGGSVVLAPEPADAAAWLGRIQFASLVPTQVYRLLESRTDVLSNRPVVLVGGGPVEPGLLDRADMAGMVALPTYGMTETTSQVAAARSGDPFRRMIPLEGVEIEIGGSGRIRVRGPTVSPGYLDEPDRVTGDWFETADLGRIESDGSLQVIGRVSPTIISGGENVDPAEVEAAIGRNPYVVEVAVVGLPDEKWGEIVAAAYVGDATPDQLRDFIANQIPNHAIPKRWLQVELLPRTDLGKIDNWRLVRLFASEP
jgi:O-succinylbenzoic acid--CoA ligase